MKKSYLAILIIFAVLVIDQALKIWIKTSFYYGEERAILGLSWANLHFVENPGMAFGWKFGGEYGKLALRIFRLIAIGFLIYYISRLIKRQANNGLIISFSLILAGAVGNIIDSAFYGFIFSESDHYFSNAPSHFVGFGSGHDKFLQGKVVDMLFFPFWRDAQGNAIFFQHVFNIADSAITIGVVSLLLFQRSSFNSFHKKATDYHNLDIEHSIGNNKSILLENNDTEIA